MARDAAIFDLDRTLLAGASGPVITQHLRLAGVLPERSIPGEGAIYRIFDIVGENRPTMMITRQAARAAAGWAVDDVRAAGEAAAEVLADRVPHRARTEIARHREEGRLLVLATTTPHDLIEPLARRLGIDAVVATRYAAREGTYTGGIEGEFVWGRGKERAVRSWAAESDVDLARSHAYSDSWYDVPLLGTVGHPHAVNPDPRLLAYAAARRWPIEHFDVPPGIPKLLGVEPQRALLALTRPEMFPYARFRFEGVEHIPRTGPALVVANHRSYFDVVALGLTFGRAGRAVRFLGKRELFDVPVAGPLLRALGGIQVDRGSGSAAPLQAAEAALAAGDLVAILPQGTIPRGPAFFDPELQGRHGAARLAATTGVPVVPVGLWGTERVWPRSSRVPEAWNVLHPPTVSVTVGAALDPLPPEALQDLDGATRSMMAAIVDLLPDEARQRHEPTAEELARTYPPGAGPAGDAPEG
ncbi:HAD-IB family hydrolase [Actinomarinicola tropica]|uniref:HAD-IB family hydrolase n=1 Tax=Actinomarinicola tropica TaxID=2789776 RepID=A0A5Q2RLY6_9ACTN|nr:HAD-IB family hydrolase [Actinomarinicola tropica]QGG95097.1 HAD-IB family hydrolase [Actinomarinicola tropica]